MSQDISALLKEATKDLLSEDTLSAISQAIEKKAEEKAQLAVEAALVQQDEEYATKLEKVLEAIDTDHTEKLDKLVERIDTIHSKKFKHALDVLDETHSSKLVKIVSLYEKALEVEAGKFKSALVENLSNYIDLYIGKAIPTETIKEATENTRARKIVSEIKRIVSLSDDYVNENIKEALIDGKNQINEAKEAAKTLERQLKLITEKAGHSEKLLFLEKKLTNFPAPKKEYMLRVLSEKPLNSIQGNFQYVSEMYDKKEDGEVAILKESTVAKTKGVDITPIEVKPKRQTLSTSTAETDAQEGAQFVTETYLPAIKKTYL